MDLLTLNGKVVMEGKPQRLITHRTRPEKLHRARELRRAMTAEERILWQHLRDHQLCGLHFRRQHVIEGFFVDFYCPAALLAVEVDGGVHLQQVDYDTERDRVLLNHGLRVLRVSNTDVRNDLPRVLAQIAEACQRA